MVCQYMQPLPAWPNIGRSCQAAVAWWWISVHCCDGGDGMNELKVVWCPVYVCITKFCHRHRYIYGQLGPFSSCY